MKNRKTRTGASATQRNSVLPAKAFASGRVLVNRTGAAVAVVIVATCSSSLEERGTVDRSIPVDVLATDTVPRVQRGAD
ncbi:hypothetical protein GCM10009854_21750 [Saccharopolyspora halophila]|uniref:Uncharacterized protein n=1 Tax=Saccharopolyspora halophila TaxID=405551 RepID=A0ABN3G5I3_9PSEU